MRTIEGFNDDAVMALLRDAFTAEHALQCGYCTPGMLIAARDLICRRGTLTEPQIRVEMSGNLCRCTGYAGIVRAIARVMTAVTSEMKPAHPVTAWLGPAPGPTAGGSLAATGRAQTSSVVSDRTTSPARQIKVVTGPIRLDGATTRLTQSFVITQPLAQVWARLADLGSVVPCMPGAALDGPLRDDGAFTAHLALRLGPIRTTFAGEGIFSRDDNAKTCRIQGRGRDRSGPSAVQGEVVYRATAVDGAATRVDAEIGYSLAGPLAQFGRPGLVHSLVAHFGEIFALNLDAAVAGRAPPATGGNELGLWSLLRALVRRWRNRLTGQHR